METPYGGSLELSGAQRDLLLALLTGPILTVGVVERGSACAALHLRDVKLVEWIPETGWQLTDDGASLANRIAAS